ncbi:transglutaminase domain-containing protein [Butyrivibrio sp. JL13D10]|uniref:transglutaminase domain-containing protein n=1 Tax=Butyrivibrio sp. JL13D10 TaxID=3236815 RepID=UPI0038B43403
MKNNVHAKSTLSLLMSFVLFVTIFTLSFPISSKAASDPKVIKAIKTYKGTFDSGIILNDNYTVEMGFSLDGLDQYSNVFQMDSTIVLRNESTRGLFTRYGWYNEAFYKPMNKGMNVVKLQGNVFTINDSAVKKAAKQNLSYKSTLKFGNFNGEITYVTIKNANQVPVADLYAALDENGKACMYDTVARKYVYASKDCTAISGTNEYYKGVDTKDQNANDSQNKNEEVDKEQAAEQAENSEADNTDEQNKNNTTPLKALEINNGTFNTGIIINQDNSYEMIFEMANTAIYKDIVTSSPYVLRCESTKGLYARHGWANEAAYKIQQDTLVDYLQKKNEVYVDGKMTKRLSKQTIAGVKSLTFGGFQGKIEMFKVFDSANKVIAEIVPVLDENDVACLEDTVSGKLIYCSKECKPVYASTPVLATKPQYVGKDMELTLEDEIDNEDITDTEIVEEEIVKEETPKKALTREEEVRYAIVQAIETGDSSVHNISKYGFKSFKEVSALFKDAVSKECRIAYNSAFNMSIDVRTASNGIVETFSIRQMDSGYLNRYADLKRVVNEVKQKTQGMTELQKIVYIHDYVAIRTAYSTSGNMTNTAVGALVQGKALCLGYARAMVLLLQETGVEAEVVSPVEMNHAWCKVKLDGQWYYADSCWDDPERNNNIEVAHKYLLRNEKEFSNLGYKGVIDGTCTSAKYVNWNIHDVNNRIDYNGSYWFYIDGNTHKEVRVEL